MSGGRDPFRVGIIGAGYVAEGYHAPVLRQMDGVRIEWVCDRDEGKAARLAREHRISIAATSLDGLPDVDGVLVAIPLGSRRGVLETAFERRWNVFVEKPFAVSTVEHQRVLDQARSAGVQVGVGLMRRFYRPVLEARALLREGLFGPLREIWAAEGRPMRGSGRSDDWYQSDPRASGGGVLAETGSHLIDQALFMADVSEVGEPRAESVATNGLDLETMIAVAVRRRGQSEPFDLRVALSRLRDLCNGIVLRFDGVTVKVGLSFNERIEILDERLLPRRTLTLGSRGAVAVYQAFALQWMAFIDQCRQGVSSEVNASTAVLVTEVIESSYRAMASEVAP